MTPGKDTTEFWFAMGVVLVASIAFLTDKVSAEWWLGAITIAGASYGWARAKVKAAVGSKK